jgi:DnaJ family protein C protein 13
VFQLFKTLFAENKEKMINATLAALLEREGDQTNIPADELEAQFQALRRLVASKAGFSAFTALPQYGHLFGFSIKNILRRDAFY